ncbi:ATP-binding protein [Streptomyces tsukubensis]|uniref:ATP-binding protein n=1 Tax=Streptomyces tsukubensis TaxID=83656 RepID=UPI003F4E7222
MSIWWSLHLRREAASIPLARRLLIGTMETAGVDPDISFDLSVALSEACANAVEHGGGAGPGGPAGAYRVTAYLDGEKCRIEVSDSGPGFPGGSPRHGRGCTHSEAPYGVQEGPGAPAPAGAGAVSGVPNVRGGPGGPGGSAGPGSRREGPADRATGGPQRRPSGRVQDRSPDGPPHRPHQQGEPAGSAGSLPGRTAAATAESGRGLCLIEELADHVHFSNRPGRGAVVSFDKILKWREDALLKVS